MYNFGEKITEQVSINEIATIDYVLFKVGADVLQTNQTNARDLKKFDALSVIDITLEKR